MCNFVFVFLNTVQSSIEPTLFTIGATNYSSPESKVSISIINNIPAK